MESSMNWPESIYATVKCIAMIGVIAYAIYITQAVWPLLALVLIPIWKNDKENTEVL